jgi:hypothetical protein
MRIQEQGNGFADSFGYLNDNEKASKIAEMVALLICINEEPSLNLCQDTDYPDSVFPRFCQVPSGECWDRT